MADAQLKLSDEGAGAILVDVAGAVFDAGLQGRIWALAESLTGLDGVSETVPGMNNCMVVFDPLILSADDLETAIRQAWQTGATMAGTGIIHEIPVTYGGPDSDLAALAIAKGMGIDELVKRHSSPIYGVAAVGAMPGFPYLSGLDPILTIPRHAQPRSRVPAGAVIIGGAQAGIMPITAPSGWHILGQTQRALFDPQRSRPALMAPGDQVRFVVEAILP